MDIIHFIDGLVKTINMTMSTDAGKKKTFNKTVIQDNRPQKLGIKDNFLMKDLWGNS